MWTGEDYSETRDGTNLVVAKQVDLNGNGLMAYLLATRSMEGEIAAIDRFCDRKKAQPARNLVFLGLSFRYTPLVALFLALFFLLAFLGFRLLLRKNVTRPVEELSAVVERVMEGDLEETIPAREGEDIEALQRVFRDFVDSSQRIISRSLEGE